MTWLDFLLVAGSLLVVVVVSWLFLLVVVGCCWLLLVVVVDCWLLLVVGWCLLLVACWLLFVVVDCRGYCSNCISAHSFLTKHECSVFHDFCNTQCRFEFIGDKISSKQQ